MSIASTINATQLDFRSEAGHGSPSFFSNRSGLGQVIGAATLPGDTPFHPFVWNTATGITDLLDPSDSSFGYAAAENAHGDIAGQICNAVICNAVLWRKRSGHWEKTILGTTAQISFGWSINASEQVVGNLYITNGTAAFLSEGGGPVVDLNTLVPAGFRLAAL